MVISSISDLLVVVLSASCLLLLFTSLPAASASKELSESQREALAKLQEIGCPGNSCKHFERTLALLQQAMGTREQAQETEEELDGGDDETSLTLIGGLDGGAQVKVAQLIALSNFELSKCDENYFRKLVEWRKQFKRLSYVEFYIRSAIKRQRRFCENYLDEQVDARLASFSEQTKRHFELFLGHDQIGRDFYVSPESSVAKLRELLQAHAAQTQTQTQTQTQMQTAVDNNLDTRPLQAGFLASCREITSQLESLVPIRKDHDIFARLPMARDRYFRAYEFCRQLVDINFSEELSKSLFLDIGARSEITSFGVYLRSRLARSEQSEQGNQRELESQRQVTSRNQVIEAARDFVRDRLPLSTRGRQAAALAAGTNQQATGQILDKLKAACASSLELTESLRWLRDNNFAQTSLTPRALEYLRALDGCAHLLSVGAPDLVSRPKSAKAGYSARELERQGAREEQRERESRDASILRRLIRKVSNWREARHNQA